MPAPFLIVIPNDCDRLAYEEALGALGYLTASATCVGEALESVRRCPPDLVILDEHLRLADGSDPIPAFRAACRAPIVLSVRCGPERCRLVALTRGADDALTTPPERMALTTTVRCLCQHKHHMDRMAQRQTELEERLKDICTQVDLTVRGLRDSLSSALMNVAYLQESLGGRPQDTHLTQAAEDALEALDQAIGRLDRLAATARTSVLERHLTCASIDLAELIRQVILSRRTHAQARRVELGVEVEPGLELDADRELLTRVAHHLVDESLRQTGPGGRVLLRAQPDADEVEITVCSSGYPSPPRDTNHAERPTLPVRTAPDGRDPALEFCQEAVHAHGGSMRVEERPDWPVSYVIRLPRTGAPPTLRAGDLRRG